MTTTTTGEGQIWGIVSINDTNSPYTTDDDAHIFVDTTTAAVTVTLATADVDAGREIRIVDTGGNAGTNAITVNTEGAEVINPGGVSSFTLSVDGDYVDLFSDGTNWFTDRNRSGGTRSIDDLIPAEISVTNGDVIVAGNQDGADADARLDNALNAASAGDLILLEATTYTTDRTGVNSIDTRLFFIGFGSSTIIDNGWEINGSASGIERLHIENDDTIQLNSNDCYADRIVCSGTITIGADRVVVTNVALNGAITFEAGTVDGNTAGISGAVTVTDNGTNP